MLRNNADARRCFELGLPVVPLPIIKNCAQCNDESPSFELLSITWDNYCPLILNKQQQQQQCIYLNKCKVYNTLCPANSYNAYLGYPGYQRFFSRVRRGASTRVRPKAGQDLNIDVIKLH